MGAFQIVRFSAVHLLVPLDQEAGAVPHDNSTLIRLFIRMLAYFVQVYLGQIPRSAK